ncbi:hypothetical protein CBER1_07549 [Cercospora berteroae]|uniref:F-box domain-containing protein n=1 Tax=Cercospora berteroae TaxID=357750 RepID=A0A2S6BU93_9PEZI|nr:hypothetical protein CBER1_07549 [Cercospora berteroae]
MASLLTLPTELLVLILEHVGGRELRRSQTGKSPTSGPGWRATDKLLLCREWYAAARPVFLSGLHLSEVRLYACNLDRLDGELSYKKSRTLMHNNTRSLTVRLLGHFWDLNSAEDLERWYAEDAWSGPAPWNESPSGLNPNSASGKLALKGWRDQQMRPRLDELLEDLRNFTELKYLEFTATSDPHQVGLDWDYIHTPTISRLLQNLPITQGLRALVLDTVGTRLLGDDGETHLCTEVARVLPYIEHVRLRMINICPAIFGIDQQPEGRNVTLETLILKLYMPDAFEHSDERRSEPCQVRDYYNHHDSLYDQMVECAFVFLNRLSELRGHGSCVNPVPRHKHGMASLAITYRDIRPGIPASRSPIFTSNIVNNTQQRFSGHGLHGWLHRDEGRYNWCECTDDR